MNDQPDISRMPLDPDRPMLERLGEAALLSDQDFGWLKRNVCTYRTATVLTMLAAQGKLSLDEPIDKWVPEFKGIKVRGKGPVSHVPTLSECLSHTSNLKRSATEDAENP